VPELMLAAEIADKLVVRQWVHQLRSAAAFPAPTAELRGVGCGRRPQVHPGAQAAGRIAQTRSHFPNTSRKHLALHALI
jgi:hypothetical protein